MSDTFTPTIVKTKPSFNTTDIFVHQGGELFLSKGSLPNLNRLVSSKQHENGTEIKLILVPGDTYRMRSKVAKTFGPGFTTLETSSFVSYSEVNSAGILNEIKTTKAVGFVAVTFNHTLMADVYNSVINKITLGKHMINVAVNEAFSIRDMSKSPMAYLGNNMLVHRVAFKYNDEGKMTILDSTCLTIKEAFELLEKPLPEDIMIVRQHVRDSKAIQVVFSPENSNVHYVALSNLLRQAIPKATINRKGDRYNVSVDIGATVRES